MSMLSLMSGIASVLEENHFCPQATNRLVRRLRDHVAMLEGKGVLLRGNKARDVSANLIRDGARHHRESWQGGRSTPVSATPLGVHTIRERLEVGECGGDLLSCVVTVGQNDERVRCQQSRVHGKVRWAARMRERIADCHDHTAEVAKLNILGNTAVIKRREGITTTASATPIRILRIRASRINSARFSMAALSASPNDGRARQCRSPTSHWPNQNQHIRQATFAKSGGTGCPHKSMVACHTPSTMPQTARTLNSKLELQSPGAATSNQIYRSVRVRLPTITRHDGAVTVGDQNRRLGVQVIVDVYEKWLRGVAADRQRFFER